MVLPLDRFDSEVWFSSDQVIFLTVFPEADLGMFSMFGRTQAPTERGPHKRTGKFLQHCNMPEIIETRNVGQCPT